MKDVNHSHHWLKIDQSNGKLNVQAKIVENGEVNRPQIINSIHKSFKYLHFYQFHEIRSNGRKAGSVKINAVIPNIYSS